MKKMYYIRAYMTGGTEVDIVRDIESHENAKKLLAHIIKTVSTRKSRYVSVEDLVFDPSPVLAYEIYPRYVCEETDRTEEVEGTYTFSEVIDMDLCTTVDGAETEAQAETVDMPAEGSEE